MTKKTGYFTHHTPKTLIVGVDAPYNGIKSIDAYFQEFVSLVKTNRVTYAQAHFIALREINAAYFFTQGKLEKLLEICTQHAIEEVIISEALTTQQERNLNDFLECKIIDRTRLILEIFQKAAHSAEGKLQVAIALMQHEKTRLAGKGIHMSQQVGVSGVRSGPGEKAKERERRHIEQEIRKLKKQLKSVQKTRDVQRKQRVSSGTPHICIIGYTNAGKSTLLNALTRSNVLAENRLFATLDTTTRQLYHNKEKIGIISDTVGFIQQLPHQLIEAFKSTLDELQYADLLLHVVDITDTNWQTHIEVVHTILDELKVYKDIIYVFNKADKHDGPGLSTYTIDRHSPHFVVSAHKKESLTSLLDALASWKQKNDAIPPTTAPFDQFTQSLDK